jgi:hypothetical protein
VNLSKAQFTSFVPVGNLKQVYDVLVAREKGRLFIQVKKKVDVQNLLLDEGIS